MKKQFILAGIFILILASDGTAETWFKADCQGQEIVTDDITQIPKECRKNISFISKEQALAIQRDQEAKKEWKKQVDSGREWKTGSPWQGDTKTWKNATGSGFVEAVKSLKQLQAKIEVGISYKDYTVALGDVKFAVDNFLASRDAKDKPALSSAMRNSLKCHIDAKTLWQLKIEGTELNKALRGLGIYDKSDDFLRTGGKHIDDIWKVLVRDYPEFAALSTAGKPQLDGHGDRYYTVKIDYLIRLLWAKASALTPVVER